MSGRRSLRRPRALGKCRIRAPNHKGKDQPDRVTNPARGQLNRKMLSLVSSFAPENLVPRGFGGPVPRQPAHLNTRVKSGAYLRDPSRFPRRPFIYLNRHTPSSQFRVYRVTQLRTDGVHCRESAGKVPVNINVVPNGCCLGRSLWTS